MFFNLSDYQCYNGYSVKCINCNDGCDDGHMEVCQFISDNTSALFDMHDMAFLTHAIEGIGLVFIDMGRIFGEMYICDFSIIRDMQDKDLVNTDLDNKFWSTVKLFIPEDGTEFDDYIEPVFIYPKRFIRMCKLD